MQLELSAYSIFKLGRASTPEIIAYLYETFADRITDDQIDALATLFVHIHNDARSALRIIRASSAMLPTVTSENLTRLEKALTDRQDR